MMFEYTFTHLNSLIYSNKLFKLKDHDGTESLFTNIGNLKCFKLGIIENNTENKENKTFVSKQRIIIYFL